MVVKQTESLHHESPLRSFLPSAVSVPKTVPLLLHSSRVWCLKTARHLIGHRGVPAPRPAAPLTCLPATASGHGSWHRSPLVEAGDARPLKKKRLVTSLEIYFQTAPGNQRREGESQQIQHINIFFDGRMWWLLCYFDMPSFMTYTT